MTHVRGVAKKPHYWSDSAGDWGAGLNIQMKFTVFPSGAKRLSDAEKLSGFPDSTGGGEGEGVSLSAVLEVKKSPARYFKLAALIELRCRLYESGKYVY